MNRHHLTLAAALLATICGANPHAQTPIRDRQHPATGSGAIAGMVVNDDPEARPLRRARVMINNADRTVGRTVVTDDSGTFEITGLPPGRYTLTATKDGHITVAYGAKRLGRPGTAIVLGTGQRITNVILRIPRGAVLTGMVLDEHAQPLPGVRVEAARSIVLNGGRQFVPAGMPQVTDDRGMYRIYGLMPGEYIVSAAGGLGAAAPGDEVRMITDADVQRALRSVRSPFLSTWPAQSSRTDAAAASQSGQPTTIAYAPVFHPGVMLPDHATRIALGVAEERGGVDVQMLIVPTARVEGTVVAPAGVSPDVSVNMLGGSATILGPMGGHFKFTRANGEGRFSFSGVLPGQYSILARSETIPFAPAAQPAGLNARQASHWGQADIVVDGHDISDVLLSLQPGTTVTGIVRFEGSVAPPEDLSRVRVNLAAAPSRGQVRLGVSPAQVAVDGTFTIPGVTPGSYRIAGNVPSGGAASEWSLKSIVVDGQSAMDTLLDVQPGRSPGEIVLTFTDRIAVLSGTLQDAAGNPAPDYFIIVFTTDRTKWRPQSRLIASSRPFADGRYEFRGIPPGEYFLAAVEDVEQGEWYDPAFLESLVTSSMRVAIGEGEQKTQHLRLAAIR
jgi:protocatechuate 3,4-dioxygenase beta subunit